MSGSSLVESRIDREQNRCEQWDWRTPYLLRLGMEHRPDAESLRHRCALPKSSSEAGAENLKEAALCEVIAPNDNVKARKALVKAVTKQVDADYVLRLGTNRDGLLPLPKQGPILTWRGVTETEMPALDNWLLTLGDIELF